MFKEDPTTVEKYIIWIIIGVFVVAWGNWPR